MSADDVERGRTLAATAVWAGRERGTMEIRPVLDWLAARGLDVRRELNRQLCGGMGMKPETVRWLLDAGADPSWVAPNGIPVLEHALIRYWNGAAVDVLAARPAQPLGVDPALRAALELAGDDAFERGRHAIDPEGLLFGLLRAGGLPLMLLTRVKSMERERFHRGAPPPSASSASSGGGRRCRAPTRCRRCCTTSRAPPSRGSRATAGT